MRSLLRRLFRGLRAPRASSEEQFAAAVRDAVRNRLAEYHRPARERRERHQPPGDPPELLA